MVRVEWDKVGEREYELGVDRGMFYPNVGPGVVWNGLTSVREGSADAAVTPYHFDGVKYVDLPTLSDFDGNISAITYPDEFEACVGLASMSPGFYVANQAPKRFGLAYRTLIGNDLVGEDRGYKIHLVYNATAIPSDKTYATIAGSKTPMPFSWDISTVPIHIPGFRPSAHYEVDSTKVSPLILNVLEGILYGDDGPPRLPSPEELYELGAIRLIIVIQSPDVTLLPSHATEGDIVFSIDNTTVYKIVSESPRVRKVFVIQGSDPDLLPSNVYPGDIVYDETTSDLYKIGE